MINSINFFKNTYITKQRLQRTNHVAFRGDKLAPLPEDVVTFSNSDIKTIASQKSKTQIEESELAKLARALGSIIRNEDQCEKVSENAIKAEKILKAVLTKKLSEFVYSKEKNPDGFILPVHTRIKTPESIREKVMDAIAKLIASDKEKFAAYDIDDIKETVGDIVGARITLRNPHVEDTKKLIQKLVELVESNELKITRIENYVPDGLSEELKYFDEKDLETLAVAVNKQRAKRNLELIKVETKAKKTGYMALHLDVDLSNREKLLGIQDGYQGEIQIVGYDVEKLKDVEDCCYKIKQGKNIKGGDRSYSALVEYFNKYIEPTAKYPNSREDFIEYTRRAYLEQRKRKFPDKASMKDTQYQLPTIEQCNMQGKIPPQLDFNVLSKIKTRSDELYYTVRNARNSEE